MINYERQYNKTAALKAKSGRSPFVTIMTIHRLASGIGSDRRLQFSPIFVIIGN